VKKKPGGRGNTKKKRVKKGGECLQRKEPAAHFIGAGLNGYEDRTHRASGTRCWGTSLSDLAGEEERHIII